MESVLFYYLVIFTLLSIVNSDYSGTDSECPKNETIGQQKKVEILRLWEYAWTVMIGIQSYHFSDFEPDGIVKTFFCSGSLLKPYLVLTSASCLHNVLSNYKVIEVFVYGDYNRTEIAVFTKNGKNFSPSQIVDPQDKKYTCDFNNLPLIYKTRNIYYYNYAEEYKESEPDIAFIGLKKSILFNCTNRILVPVANPCYSIDYNKCLITELQQKNRSQTKYSCEVLFKNKTTTDGFMEQSFKKEFGTLRCYQKDSENPSGFYGGNPIVCKIKKSDPEEFVQIGILQMKKKRQSFVYLPDIITL